MPAAATPWDIPADWPTPDATARAVSEALAGRIRAGIDAAGGWLDFARYMELALYAPGLGYYSAGAHKLGARGDFTTAPEVSALFSRCVARSCASVLAQLDGGHVLEVGAGSGALAAEMLRELESLGCLPERYLILERSADLRERQQEHLLRSLPHLYARIHWLDVVPARDWHGVLVANEVLDALPVTLFGWRPDAVVEYGVSRDGERFAWAQRPASPALAERVAAWAGEFGWEGDYRSELVPSLAPWLQTLTERLTRGAALFVDYGYPRREYYHPERGRGTLLCHYRHRAHAEPLLLPGLQDITAHVDFTAVAEAADALGLCVAGFASQAQFLLDAGIEAMLAEALPQTGAQSDYLRLAAQAKTLLLPGEMGERFKAMLLMRGVNGPVAGFGGRDLRGRL
ncbi:MAG: class I SAM-dependent methyltransferase [Gammaproteobacteria bacterium]